MTLPLLRRIERAGQLWWVSPIGTVAMVVPLSLLVALRIPDADYRLFYKAPKVLSTSQATVFITGALLFVAGVLLMLARRSNRPIRTQPWGRLADRPLAVLRQAERIAFALTVLGYVLLGALGLARGATPGVLFSAIVSQDNYAGSLKQLFAPVAGVTSLTQIGIAYVVIAALLQRHGRSSRLTRRIVIVVVLGLLRAYLLTERLAVLELVVPLVAIGATAALKRPRAKGRAVLQFAPVIALPVLFVVFGAFEYSRSWVFYRAQSTQTFPGFVLNRLAGYYATSYNNGALQLDHNTASGRLPYASLEAFWTAPGPSQLDLYYRLTGQHGDDLLNTTLTQYGNPEFNNPGGLAVPFVDFGHTGGFVFFFLLGLLVGLVYTGWRTGTATGLLIYPVLFTGLLELPRYLYWTQGRVFPAFVFLAITAYVVTRAGNRRTVPPPVLVGAS